MNDPDLVAAMLSRQDFDPEGAGYDHKTAQELMNLHPLTMPRPSKYMGDVMANPGAFQAWVWHPEKNDYLKHSSSRDPRTGMILKGMQYETIDKSREADRRMGYTWGAGNNGRYYSAKRMGGR